MLPNTVRSLPRQTQFELAGHSIVPMGDNGCAYFPFEELCDRPLKVIMNFLVADYFGLCKNFLTLALEGVPIFGLHNRSAAYRFVTLVNVMFMRIKEDYYVAWGTPLLNYSKG